jgi:enoyl-CoA hydratase
MDASVDIARPLDHVAIATLQNPPANVLTWQMRRQLAAMLDEIEADTALRVLILQGAGTNFCTGVDIREEQDAALGSADKRPDDLLPIFARLETLRVPVIAAINGWCVGAGLELALCSDIRIASSKARFVCAGVNVGLLAHAYRLPRAIGAAMARQMLLTGSSVDASEAKAFGLISEVVEPDALAARALGLAERIASRAPLAVEATKRLANAAFDLASEAARERLVRDLEPLFESADHREALAAFAAKRTPLFQRN